MNDSKQKKDFDKFYSEVREYLAMLNENSPFFFRTFELRLFLVLAITFLLSMLIHFTFPELNDLVKLVLGLSTFWGLDHFFITLPWRFLEKEAMKNVVDSLTKKEEPALKDLITLRQTKGMANLDYEKLDAERNYLCSIYLRRRMKM